MDQLCINERKTYVNMAIAQLNTADATLLNLYYHNECSLAEIEEITGTTKETLKVQLYRARKRFETALGNILKGEIKSIL